MRSPAKAPLLPGVLSTRMWIKQRNNAAETLLTSWAEPLAALAEITGAPLELHGQSALVRQAWRYLLQNHPHDSICGCSVDQVHREMAIRFDWVDQIGQEIVTRSMQALAAIVDTADGPAVVVFNPTTQARTDRVEARIPIPEDAVAVVLESEGQTVTPQAGERKRDVTWEFTAEAELMRGMIGYMSGRKLADDDIHGVKATLDGTLLEIEIKTGKGALPDFSGVERDFGHLMELLSQEQVEQVHVLVHRGEVIDCTFVARDVPGLGYRAYHIRPVAAAETAATSAQTTTIENTYLRVEVAPDGTFTLLDKTTGTAYPGLHRLVDMGDRGDEYNFNPVEEDVVVAGPVDRPTVRLVAGGPVRQTLEVTQTYRVPASLGETRSQRSIEMVDLPMTTRISLIDGVPRVEVETTVENHARDHRLRVHFPVSVTVDTFDAEGHFDVITRPLDLPTDTEGWIEQPVGTYPQHAWADVSDGTTGLLLANRGLPEVEVLRTATGSELALTLLRSVGWLSRADLSVRQGHAGPGLPTPEAQCPGTHTFAYALVPHCGHWQQAYAQAHAFNAPLRAIPTPAHAGTLPPVGSFVAVAPDVLVVSAIKEAENGTGLIVRLWNTDTTACEGVIRFWKRPRRVSRCNLNERGQDALTVDKDGTVHFPVRGREIVTLRAEF